MIKDQEGDVDIDLGGPLTSAERLVRLFLEGAAVILPCSSGSGSPASREARWVGQPTKLALTLTSP